MTLAHSFLSCRLCLVICHHIYIINKIGGENLHCAAKQTNGDPLLVVSVWCCYHQLALRKRSVHIRLFVVHSWQLVGQLAEFSTIIALNPKAHTWNMHQQPTKQGSAPLLQLSQDCRQTHQGCLQMHAFSNASQSQCACMCRHALSSSGAVAWWTLIIS